MNPYLRNLRKIEFAVTYACTGRCRHCSEGEHSGAGVYIDPAIAARAVKEIAAEYAIETVMAFGGEPLLYPDAVCAIIAAGTEMQIPRRQVITNGYFTKDPCAAEETAARLAACGVNDLRLSVDAFHQETIPLGPVMEFAARVQARGIPIQLQPAWLVSPGDGNPYNLRTREILARFGQMGIPENPGNVIFPEGNARKYLAEYFTGNVPENPYTEDPRDVRCVSFSPNGDVLDGNVYREDAAGILRKYTGCGAL